MHPATHGTGARSTLLLSLLASTAPLVAPCATAQVPLQAEAESISPALPQGDGEPDSLTIEGCYALARDRAPAVRVAQAQSESARFDAMAAARNRWPILTWLADATIAPRGFYDPAFTNLGQYEVTLGVEVPLFDGGERRRARLLAAQGRASAAIEMEQAQRDAGLRAADLAIEILRLQERATFQRQAIEWLDRLASTVALAVRAGARGPSDALRVALERDAENAAIESTTLDLGTATRELNDLVGRSPVRPIRVHPPDPAGEGLPSVADSARVVGGVDRLPEIRLARVAHAEQTVELAEVRGLRAPRVDASANAGLAGTDLTEAVPPDLRVENPNATFGDRLRRDLGASVGLAFRLPLIDPSWAPSVAARRSQVQAAALRVDAEISTQQRLALDLMARWSSAGRRARRARELVDQAEENLLRLKSRYVGGTSSLLDLLDARQVLEETSSRLADARAEARAARFEAEIRP